MPAVRTRRDKPGGSPGTIVSWEGALHGAHRHGRRVEQAALEYLARPVELRLPFDLRSAVQQTIAHFFQRVTPHMGTFIAGTGDARHRMEPMPRKFLLQAPH